MASPLGTYLHRQYAMTLDYLDFDYSEDEEGTGTWDAMASVKAERVPALAAEIAQLLRLPRFAVFQQKLVVADGLDFQIVVKAGDAHKFFLGFSMHNRAEQLARLTGTAHNQPFAVLLDQLAGHVGVAVKVMDVPLAYQMVQVLHALLAFAKQDDVVGIAHAFALYQRIHIGKLFASACAYLGEHLF